MEAPRQVTVRAGRPEDLPALRAILAASPEAAPRPGDASFDGEQWLSAWAEEQCVGFVSYRVVLGEAEILNLAVAPTHRRQGVASQLLRVLLPLADVWFLEVRASNEAAQRLYLAQGFQPIGRRKRYYSDGEDALLYRWP